MAFFGVERASAFSLETSVKFERLASTAFFVLGQVRDFLLRAGWVAFSLALFGFSIVEGARVVVVGAEGTRLWRKSRTASSEMGE